MNYEIEKNDLKVAMKRYVLKLMMHAFKFNKKSISKN